MSILVVRQLISDLPRYRQETINVPQSTKRILLPDPPISADTPPILLDPIIPSTLAIERIDYNRGWVEFDRQLTTGNSITVGYSSVYLSDAAIQSFLDLNGADVRLAASTALESIASNQALLYKVSSIGDITISVSALSSSLRAHAKELREQAETSPEGQFDWAEQVHLHHPDQFLDRILKQHMRHNP